MFMQDEYLFDSNVLHALGVFGAVGCVDPDLKSFTHSSKQQHLIYITGHA